ncbi:MAG TPA: hypothetical protein VFJ97_02150 [Dermatophilaceae bacterium]|nr:hypothetical protein [Dermatophilaceae bacterium]
MKIRIAAVGAAAAALAVVTTALPASAAESRSSITSPRGQLGTSAVAAPSNVAPAASVSFSITNAQCFSNAITFTAKTQENGRSGVQQFKQTAVEQRFNGLNWVNITAKAVVKSAKFPNDFRNFSFTRDWSATHAADGASYRVVWQGFYLNGFGATLFKTKPIKINCF